MTLRQPALAFAEIAWRWAAGATVISLAWFGLREYLSTLPVGAADLLFLRTGQPALVGQALAHIFRGSLLRAVMSGLVAWLGLNVLWMVAASVGRLATARAALDYFREKFAGGEVEAAESAPAGRLRGLLGLNFLRAGVGLATLVGGIFGASVLAGRVGTPASPHPRWSFLVFAAIALVVVCTFFLLNWMLSVAALFAVRDSADTLQALQAAVGFCRDRSGPVAAVSAWFGLAHLVLLSIASSVIAFPLGLAQVVPGRVVLVLLSFVLLIYFALVDWLYVGRLAAYACIVEMPEPQPEAPPAPTAPIAATAITTAMDSEEPILSDVPAGLQFQIPE